MDVRFWSAIRIASGIRSGHLTATDALEACLAQIDRHNPALNAVVTVDADGARRRAKQADAARARGELYGPLHGVPFTLKDAFATAGMRTTVGFPPLDHVPTEDSTVAARLKAAGGILIGKTNVAALLSDYQTSNPIFGRTNNPWNLERTPGGSSGGAAAAVAAGMTPFDIGTDMSASIRVPAHMCGVFGLKPTEHRASLIGVVPGLSSPRGVRVMSCVGPMARTVEDLALLYGIIAGPDGRDTDVPPVPVDDMPDLEFRRLRIAFAPTFPGFPAAGVIRQAVQELARRLSRHGATVDEAALPRIEFTRELTRTGELIGMAVGAFHPEDGSQPIPLARYLEALHVRDASILAWEQFFDRWDALLCPASMTTAFPHCAPGAPLRVDGQDVAYWMVSAHGALFNYTGHPAVVLPYTLDRDGLPLGVQLVGKRWGESRLLAIARAVSLVTGEFRRPPGFQGRSDEGRLAPTTTRR